MIFQRYPYPLKTLVYTSPKHRRRGVKSKCTTVFTYGVLRLHAEQETRSERIHFTNARHPRRVVVSDRHVQIAVVQRYQPPYDGEAQPAEHEVHRKHQQRPSPLCVDERRKYVLKYVQKTCDRTVIII